MKIYEHVHEGTTILVNLEQATRVILNQPDSEWLTVHFDHENYVDLYCDSIDQAAALYRNLLKRMV